MSFASRQMVQIYQSFVVRQTMCCISSPIAYRESANHIGRFFLLAIEAHKKVIMEEKWDLAQWITTCNIDLFEQHITLRFPLLGLTNRLLIWCPLIKSRDCRQQPATAWRLLHPFEPAMTPATAAPYPLRLTERKHLELWDLAPRMWEGPGGCRPLGGAVALPKCERERVWVWDATDSIKKVWTLPMIWHKAETLSGSVVNHNADKGTSMLSCLCVAFNNIMPLHMRKQIGTPNHHRIASSLFFL